MRKAMKTQKQINDEAHRMEETVPALPPLACSAVPLPHHYAFSHEATPQRLWNAEDMEYYAAACLTAGGGSLWRKETPDDIGLWWWWNEDEDSEPIPVSISYSGTSGTYFAMAGQWGWNTFQEITGMGGLWMPVRTPETPKREEG